MKRAILLALVAVVSCVRSGVTECGLSVCPEGKQCATVAGIAGAGDVGVGRRDLGEAVDDDDASRAVRSDAVL